MKKLILITISVIYMWPTLKCMSQNDLDSNLRKAVQANNFSSAEKVMVLLLQGANPTATDENGNTALHEAACCAEFFNLCYGSHVVAKMLLTHSIDQKYNANPNAKNRIGNTPMHINIRIAPNGRCSFNYDLIKVLLQHGADPRIPNNAGISPLSLFETAYEKCWKYRFQ